VPEFSAFPEPIEPYSEDPGMAGEQLDDVPDAEYDFEERDGLYFDNGTEDDEFADGGETTGPVGDTPESNTDVAIPEAAAGHEIAERTEVDSELATLLGVNAAKLGSATIDELLAANDAYNYSRPLGKNGAGEDITDPNAGHRDFLNCLPNLTNTAEEAGIDAETVKKIVLKTIPPTSLPTPVDTGRLVDSVAGALKMPRDAEPQLATTAEVEALQKLLNDSASTFFTQEGMELVAAARQAGLPLGESIGLVQRYLDTSTFIETVKNAGYFQSCLEVFDIAGADPALVVETLQAVQAAPSTERSHLYVQLKNTLAYGGPATGQSTNDLLQQITDGLRSGMEPTRAIGEAADFDVTALTDPDRVIIMPNTTPEEYFIQREGPLQHAVLPQRVTRSLEDGLRDINHLTFAASERGETVANSTWIFDPASSTWYSLGGETQRTGMHRTQTTQLPYDISTLSEHPIYVKIHSAEYAPNRPDNIGHILPSPAELHNLANQFSHAQNGLDMRMFIAHGQGMTRIAAANVDYIPDPLQRNAEMAAALQTLGQEVTINAEAAYGAVYGRAYDDRPTEGVYTPEMSGTEVAEKLFVAYDAAAGFTGELKYYPPDTDAATLVRPL